MGPAAAAAPVCSPTVIVNLDPANDGLPYVPDVDVADLVSLSDVAEAYQLGPNGGALCGRGWGAFTTRRPWR